MMKALFVAIVSLLVISAIAAQSAVLSTEPFMDRLCSQGADETWAWYEKRLETTRKIVSSCGSFDVVFIGDSITQGWENTDVREIYAALRRDFRILNLGYNGDTTSHVLWRLQHGELDGYRAKLFMVMIGTNNEGDPTTAEGVSAIVRLVRAKHPESRILLLPIFPMGAKADAPARVQRARESAKFRFLADGEKVVWLDFNKKFLEPDGTLTNWMAPDLLHLSSHGYAIWSEAVRPMFERYATDPGFADGLVTWSMAEGVASKDGEYRVTVDGRPLDVVYVPKPSMHDDQLTGEENLQPYYAVFFDADREVEVVRRRK